MKSSALIDLFHIQEEAFLLFLFWQIEQNLQSGIRHTYLHGTMFGTHDDNWADLSVEWKNRFMGDA